MAQILKQEYRQGRKNLGRAGTGRYRQAQSWYLPQAG